MSLKSLGKLKGGDRLDPDTRDILWKPGRWGILYRFIVWYEEPCPDEGNPFPPNWMCWASNIEDATLRFYDSATADLSSQTVVTKVVRATMSDVRSR